MSPHRQIPDEPTVEYLETDQLRRDRTRPLARAALSRRAVIGLWLLRIAVIVLGVMVTFTFVHSLG